MTDTVPFDIPDSWEWIRLGELTYNHGQKKPDTVFSYIDIGSIDNLNQKLNSVENHLEPDNAPSRARKIVEKWDIIYSTVRPYLHNMCIIDKDFMHPPIASTGFAVMACLADYCRFFLLYYLLSPCFDNYANNRENSKGVAYPAINDERLYRALIPVPPMEEQQRIVAKIEQILPYIKEYELSESRIGQLNAAFPEQLKKSILQEAIQGKMIPQDPSDEPASVLLERIWEDKARLIKEGKIKKDKNESVIFRRDNSYYEKIRDGEPMCIEEQLPFEIPDSWCWCRLSNILTKLSDGTHSTPKYVSSGVPFLSVKDISGGKINFANCKYISEIEHNELYKRCDPEFGDVLLTKVGTTGIPVIVDTEKQFSLFVSVALLKFNKNYIFNKYLLYAILSPLVQCQAGDNTRGVGNKNWVIRDIARTLLPIPPLAEQQRIVAKIEQFLAMIKGL